MNDRKSNTYYLLAAGMLVVIFSLILRNNINHFQDIDISSFEASKIISLIGSLFFITLLVERFLEIFAVDREKVEKDMIQRNLQLYRNDRNALIEKREVRLVSKSFAGRDVAKTDSGQVLSDILEKMSTDEQKLKELKEKRRKWVLLLAFFIGLLLSLFGVRILTDLITTDLEDGVQKTWISIMDMLLTASLIAGGSDGIHAMIKKVQTFANDTNNGGGN